MRDLMKQPHPLRRMAGIGAGISIVTGAMPTVGIIPNATAAGWITGGVGALCCLAIAVYAEPEVTPLDSPRDHDGTRLVRGDEDPLGRLGDV